MPTYPYFLVDAFTTQRFGGNPCAVFLDTDTMDEATMRTIAQEMNLSETAFVMRSKIGDFRARYFTPAEEIPLAGHPTIATIHALWDSGRVSLIQDRMTFKLELQVGLIPIDIQSHNGVIQRITMTQKKPFFLRTYDPAEVMPCFSLAVEDLLPNAVIQTVSTGAPQLMIPIKNHIALRYAVLDIPRYVALRQKSDFFSPHLFCIEGITPAGRTFARHFGTPPDTLEDPVTGSATGGMAAYLWHYGLIDSPSFIAEQGHWMNRAGKVFVDVLGERDNIEAVNVGGTAVTVMRGELVL